MSKKPIITQEESTAGNRILIFATMVAFIFAFCMVGCASAKPQVSNIEKTVQKDSISKTDEIAKSKAINDSLKIVIGQVHTSKKECDSICQQTIDNLLASMNQSKTSGDNGYKLKYDRVKKELDIVLKTGESKSEQKSEYKYKDRCVYRDVKTNIYIEKPLSKWQKFLMWTGVAALAYAGFRLFRKIQTFIPIA